MIKIFNKVFMILVFFSMVSCSSKSKYHNDVSLINYADYGGRLATGIKSYNKHCFDNVDESIAMLTVDLGNYHKGVLLFAKQYLDLSFEVYKGTVHEKYNGTVELELDVAECIIHYYKHDNVYTTHMVSFKLSTPEK